MQDWSPSMPPVDESPICRRKANLTRCETCVYFLPSSITYSPEEEGVAFGEEGVCRKNAPGAYRVERSISIGNGMSALKMVEQTFPQTWRNSWCGEYKECRPKFNELWKKEDAMAADPHVGKPHHMALQAHGLTSQQASSLMSLPNIDTGSVLTWLQTHGPAAVTMLKLLLPSLVSDPALLALLMTILNTASKTS